MTSARSTTEESYSFGQFDISKSESFAQSKLSFAFVNLKPIVPGHVLVSPQRVVPRFGQLKPEEIGDLWVLASKVGQAVEKHFEADSLTFAIQDGPAAGQSVSHVHIHILPRRAGDFERNDQVYDAIEASSKQEAADRQGKKLDLDAERKPLHVATVLPKLGALGNISPKTMSRQSVAQQTSDHPRLRVRCNGYVGEGTAPAGEYHHADFSWEDHCREVLAMIASDPVKWQHIAHDSLPKCQHSSHPLPATDSPHHGSSGCHDGVNAANPLDDAADSRPGSSTNRQSDCLEPPAQSHKVAGKDSSCTSGTCADVLAASPPFSKQVQDRKTALLQHDTHASQPASDTPSPLEIGGRTPARDSRLPAELSQDKSAAFSAGQSNFKQQQQVLSESPSHLASRFASQPGAHVGDVAVSSTQEENGCSGYSSSRWEAFHAQDNRSGRFYKERRYLLLEFPDLCRQDPPQIIAEIGCGCGSSILPVLKANPTCRAIVSDVSPSAVEMVTAAAARAGIPSNRLQASVLDATIFPDTSVSPSPGCLADSLLIVFTLAALPPISMPAMLSQAFHALKPGGRLLIRDHGLFDLTHLRLTTDNQQGHRLYSRQDGTLCYFFSCDDLQQKAIAAGFVVVECSYVRTKLLNRKTGQAMKRVFVHGVFCRP
ncbi:hypothetical protein WJX74_003913 [Apatococcus lobatus]|uniref:HIT domain-containing protein n=2 Tax=Apatococcus TaxID=904362 RepID=A0AAW1TB29_9CHLO